jgi:hypothetical protein
MNPTSGAYRIITSAKVMQQLRDCQRQAEGEGLIQEFRGALMEVATHLRTDPLEWGDPQFRLHALDLLVCHRVLRRFHVSYALDQANRLVYLRELLLVPI